MRHNYDRWSQHPLSPGKQSLLLVAVVDPLLADNLAPPLHLLVLRSVGKGAAIDRKHMTLSAAVDRKHMTLSAAVDRKHMAPSITVDRKHMTLRTTPHKMQHSAQLLT